MYCQLDQVGSILDMTDLVQKVLLDQLPGDTDITDFSVKASAMIYGLLILNDHDVFLKHGLVDLNGITRGCHWVELYLDGELFIIAATSGQNQQPFEIVFMLEDEAMAKYNFSQAQDIKWQQQFCAQSLWQPVLQELKIQVPVEQVLSQIAESNDF